MPTAFWIALALLQTALLAALLLTVWLRRPPRAADAPSLHDMQLLVQSAASQLAAHITAQTGASGHEQRETAARLERELCQQISQNARAH